MFEGPGPGAALKRYSHPPRLYPSSAAAPSIKIATTEREKEEIYRLRYKVYIEEMRGQNRHTEADNRKKQLRDHWDDRAYHFYIEQDGVVAACARLNLRQDGPLECEEHFDMEGFRPSFPSHVCMTSRLVLHPKLRGGHLLKQLTCGMYRFSLERQMRYNFIDCHPQLLPLYSRLGYRVYRAGFNHHKYTYVIPLVLDLVDIDHLKRVRSPFGSVARHLGYSSSRSVSNSWESHQPSGHADYADTDNSQLFAELSAFGLFDQAATREKTELFEGLTPEEAKTLVCLGHIISCRAGDSVLNPGDPGREIFIILSGSFQVQRPINSPSTGEVKVLKILSAGDTFGEMRFLREELRHASVKAREDSILLILNAKVLDRLVITEPRVAAKIFRNLASIVATRLCDSVRFARFSKRRTAGRSTPI